MLEFPKVEVSGAKHPVILVQGGMGAGVSLAALSGAVARRGGVGVVSSVGLDIIVGRRLGRKVSHFEAAKFEVEEAIRQSGGQGMIGINCMALMHTYEASVRGAIAGGVKAIFVGAGLPSSLPNIVGSAKVALVPIVSSVRALDVICRKWNSLPLPILKREERMPDAVVVEGPLAGGHLGFRVADIEKPEFQLEEIVPPILEFARTHGNFPVIVAGGIWGREDIVRWTDMGAAGVQMGTRFLATEESGASEDFKKAVLVATAEDIIIAVERGSPAPMPFRIIASSPGYTESLAGKPVVCNLCYMLHNGKCRALDNPGESFCICNALLAAIGYNPDPTESPIYTVGVNAARVDKILNVDKLIDELTGVRC